VVHLPFRQPLATSVEELDSANLDYLERLIEFSAELGAMKAVLHVSIRYGEDPELVEHAVEANVRQLQEIGEKHGVEIVFEHLPQESASAFELREFGERMEELGAPVCFDTGHAYVEAGQEGMEQFLEQNLDGISHLHLQDSMGGDDHVAIGHGEIDWDSAGDRLSDFEGTATFEIFTGEPRYFELSREIFLEALDS
jgi:sugar phosphate isomerase/epimerase